MLQAATSVEPIAVYGSQFDTNCWLLNCLNGTVDLKTGELRPHDPDDMLTKLAPVHYDPQARLKLWDDFLSAATNGSAGLVEFLQIAMGYGATGSTAEEKLFFIHGPTASGKSTFLEAIKATLGDYAQTANFETFLQRRQIGTARNDIAKLNGARVVVSIEVEEGKRLAEGLVKMLTGGDTVSARFLYKEEFEFVPQFKLWLAANDAPRVKDNDEAMWRRILRVPFEHEIPKQDRDPKVKATLRRNEVVGPAILAWIVQGCLKWQLKGLDVPEIIEESTEEYRQSQDPLRDFFEDECEFDPSAYVPVVELRSAYEQWARDNGARYTLGPREFNKRLESKGCERTAKRIQNEFGTEKPVKCWRGITLRSNPTREEREGIQEEIPF
jgi:putative DNA primase/helicase